LRLADCCWVTGGGKGDRILFDQLKRKRETAYQVCSGEKKEEEKRVPRTQKQCSKREGVSAWSHGQESGEKQYQDFGGLEKRNGEETLT